MTTPTLQSKIVTLHNSDGLVDLFKLDASVLGGPVLYFSNTCYPGGDLLTWGGQAYSLIPVGIDAEEQKADGQQLPRINISLSNVGGPALAYINQYDGFVGTTFYHYWTYASYLDGGANPSTSEYGMSQWKIIQISQQTNQSIMFVGACVLDIPGQQFPVRQILIYPNINPDTLNSPTIYFPGVSPYRNNQYESQ